MPTTLQDRIPWHHYSKEQVLVTLGCDQSGLSEQQVEQRRNKYGSNILRPPRKISWLQRFLLQFHNILIYVLIAAAVVTALLAHWVDTGVILSVV